jgi:hypothetical protein
MLIIEEIILVGEFILIFVWIIGEIVRVRLRGWLFEFRFSLGGFLIRGGIYLWILCLLGRFLVGSLMHLVFMCYLLCFCLI